MRHLRLVIDNTRLGVSAPLVVGRVAAPRWRPVYAPASQAPARSGRTPLECVLRAPLAPGQPTLQEVLRQANAYLACPGPEGQDWLSQQLMALMKVGVLLDVSLWPEYPAHFMIYDTSDLLRWRPALRPYRTELSPGVTFA